MNPASPVPRLQLSRADAEAVQTQREHLAHSEQLLGLPAFRWFMEECLGACIAEAQQRALSSITAPDDRDRAVHVAEALVQVRDWVEEQKETARETIRAVSA